VTWVARERKKAAAVGKDVSRISLDTLVSCGVPPQIGDTVMSDVYGMTYLITDINHKEGYCLMEHVYSCRIMDSTLMSEYQFTRSDDRAPGTWRPAGGQFRVNLTCPKCRNTFNLRRHEIDMKGKVSPSIVCPGEISKGNPCDFHVYAKLEGWEG
jgi:hypothetical protein